MRGTRLFAATAALLTGLSGAALPAGSSGAAPARPADTPVTMTFRVTPDEVKQGARITLAGRAGFGDSGNAAAVALYFRRTEADPYVRVGTARAASSGHFRATLTARASGHYEAVYRGNSRRGPASASDFVAVYTTSTADRMLYSWSGTGLQCHPECTATGPRQTLGPAPVRVTFERACAQPKSGGILGFTADPSPTPKPGTPGWRDFPAGAGPTSFELTPPVPGGHFHLRWNSPAGKQTTCDLSFTAVQQAEQKRYL